jgi:hypothetical protein
MAEGLKLDQTASTSSGTLGTRAYFSRLKKPPAVLVYAFSESPLDYQALHDVIVSGNTHLLAKRGLPIPQGNELLMIN